MLIALHPLLATHYAFGLLVVIAAVAAIFWRPARRIVIYMLLVQIALGAAGLFVLNLKVPAAHWVLSLVVGGVYSAATIAEKRGKSPQLAVGLAAACALIIAFIFRLGQTAASHSSLVLIPPN